jgi:DNA-directed RNA polymerase specialized sigma24 family protein
VSPAVNRADDLFVPVCARNTDLQITVMDPENSVSHWLGGLKRAEQKSATALWVRYFSRLVGLARKQLSAAPRLAADEEDLALSVFKSLCLRAASGGFEKLDDRDDLWRILVVITRCKAAALQRREGRLKRDFRRIEDTSLEELFADAPSPAELASLKDEHVHLMGVLPDDTLRHVALRKMQGEGIGEIAATLGISKRSVDRKLKLIRVAWERELRSTNRE